MIDLDEELIAKNRIYAKEELSRPIYDLYSRIQSFSSEHQEKVTASLEELLAIQKTTYELLLKEYRQDFSQICSFYNSSNKAIEIINTNIEAKIFVREELDFSSKPKNLLDDLITAYKKRLSIINSSEELVAVTKGLYKYIHEITEKELKSERYSQNFFKVETSYREKNIEITREKIVGNKDFIEQLDRSIKLLFLYDINKKKHPHMQTFGAYPQRIIALGNPGCGKSLTLEVMINESKDYSELYGKPLLIHDISNSLKSKYYGESANNIKSIFREVEKGNALHILVADDIDTVIFGRKETEQSENIAVFGEFIKCIESATSNNKGNYLLFATTNKPESLDEALMRRFQKKIFVKGPETKNDYESLIKIKLVGYIREGLVEIDDWQKIGSLLFEKKLSGSKVTDLATSLVDRIVDTDFEEKLFKSSFNETINILKQRYNKITEEDIINFLRF